MGKGNLMKKRRRRLMVIELIYTVVLLVFWLILMHYYAPLTTYSIPLFAAFFAGALFLIWFLGPAFSRWLLLVYGGIFTAYVVSQTCYFRAFKSYYRWNTVKDLASEVTKAADSAAAFVQKQDLVFLIGFLAIQIVFIVLFFRFEKGAYRWNKTWKFRLVCLVVSIALGAGSLTVYKKKIGALATDDGDSMYLSDSYLYERLPNSLQVVSRFGLLPYAVRDTQLFLNGSDTDSIETMRSDVESFLALRPDQETNDYTGMFAGKNAFFIQAESYNRAALDPDLTPNLWKMYSNGLRIQGFNTPALQGSTSDTELMANVSLIPNGEGHAACYEYSYNTYPTTLARMFKENGYGTTAYHNNYGEYYNRKQTMIQYGYDSFLDCTDMGLSDASSDTAVMQVMQYMYDASSEPFMGYWISYSGHQPYTLDAVGVTEENVTRVREKYPDLQDDYVSYLAKNMDLDQAIGMLEDKLQQAGLLDNTVFIVFGDHEAKELDFWGNSPFYKQTGITPEDYYRYTDLYFYCSDMETGREYDRVATTLDLVPTVANLWGFTIDTHQILGRDIFDPDYTGFFFSLWDAWKTDHYSWDFVNDRYTFFDNYDPELARQEMMYGMEEERISLELLKCDYFGNGAGIGEYEKHPINEAW